MALAKVQVVLEAGGAGKVLVDGQELPGVTAVTIHGAVREIPQVQVTLIPNQVIADLPESVVQVLRAGPSAAEFADQLDPRRLERDALQHLDEATQGEAFVAAVIAQAAEFDDRP